MLDSDEVQLILKKKKKCKKLNSLNGSWWQGPQMCVHLSRIIIGILIFGSTWGSNGGVHCIGGPMAPPFELGPMWRRHLWSWFWSRLPGHRCCSLCCTARGRKPSACFSLSGRTLVQEIWSVAWHGNDHNNDCDHDIMVMIMITNFCLLHIYQYNNNDWQGKWITRKSLVHGVPVLSRQQVWVVNRMPDSLI